MQNFDLITELMRKPGDREVVIGVGSCLYVSVDSVDVDDHRIVISPKDSPMVLDSEFQDLARIDVISEHGEAIREVIESSE